MTRTIDRIIDYVWGLDNSGGLSDTMKQVIVNRLDPPPTEEEIKRAKEKLYGTGN